MQLAKRLDSLPLTRDYISDGERGWLDAERAGGRQAVAGDGEEMAGRSAVPAHLAADQHLGTT
jgi:hypothetical protein